MIDYLTRHSHLLRDILLFASLWTFLVQKAPQPEKECRNAVLTPRHTLIPYFRGITTLTKIASMS